MAQKRFGMRYGLHKNLCKCCKVFKRPRVSHELPKAFINPRRATENTLQYTAKNVAHFRSACCMNSRRRIFVGMGACTEFCRCCQRRHARFPLGDSTPIGEIIMPLSRQDKDEDGPKLLYSSIQATVVQHRCCPLLQLD